MAADIQANADAQAQEISEARSRRGPGVGSDARLAPTCMMWSMIISFGFLIITALIWGVQHLNMIFG